MATIDILGHPVNRGGVIAGGIVAAAVSGYLIWKKHEEAQTAAATPAPAAGEYAYGYGTQYAYGYGEYAYGLNLASGGYGGYGYGGGVVSGGGSEATPTITYGYAYGYGSTIGSTAAPVTNAQWAADAEAALSSAGGYDATTVAAALGKYLTGGTVTADQATIVQAALGLEGNPPTAGANGYPPGIHESASTGQSGTTPAGGATVSVPKVDGMSANAGIAALKAAGLNYHANIERNPTSTYVINSQTPGAGTKVAKGSTVDLSFEVTHK